MTGNESKSAIQRARSLRVAGRIAHAFIDSKLTPFSAFLRLRARKNRRS